MQMVMQAFKENVGNAMRLINEAVAEIARQDWTERFDALKVSRTNQPTPTCSVCLCMCVYGYCLALY